MINGSVDVYDPTTATRLKDPLCTTLVNLVDVSTHRRFQLCRCKCSPCLQIFQARLYINDESFFLTEELLNRLVS